MKRSFLLLALLAAPQLGHAQQHAPQSLCKKQPLPDGQELLSHLFDVYEGAKTFRGTFQLDATYSENGQKVSRQQLKISTAWRRDERGDKERDFARVTNFVNSDKEQQQQNTEWFDDEQNVTFVALDQNLWQHGKRTVPTLFEQFFQPSLQNIVSSILAGVQNSPSARLIVERKRESDRDVWVVRSKPQSGFRVVVDAQTRALLELDYLDQGLNLVVRGTNQRFDAPISDTFFSWQAAPKAREAAPGEVKLLAFFATEFDVNKR